MIDRAVRNITAAGQATGRAVGDAGGTVGRAVGEAGGTLGKAISRTREAAEDVFAEAQAIAQGSSAGAGRDAAVVAGLAATTVLGVLEWPVAAAAGAGYALVRRRGGG
jgi:hypothetical protein